MDMIITNFINEKQHDVKMQFKGMNSTLNYKCEYTTKYRNLMVFTTLIPIYNLNVKLNSFVDDILKIFNISIDTLVKQATTDIQYITTRSIPCIWFLRWFKKYTIDYMNNEPTIGYKKITILNTTCIDITIGFDFYVDTIICIQKILLKILYKYNYELISIKYNDVDYISFINNEWTLYIRNTLLIISDEILFSSPTNCLKEGGIEYQNARLNYYNLKKQNPPPLPPIKKSNQKIKRKFRFKDFFKKS